MYLLQHCNVRKIAETEARRDALLALGYTEVKMPDSERPPEEPAKQSDQANEPKRKAKAE